MNINEKIEHFKIDLNKNEKLKSFDDYIDLCIKKIELLKQLKKSIFLYKITNEKIIYEFTYRNEVIFMSEENFKNLGDSYTMRLNAIRHDIGKLRLKNLTSEVIK